MLLIRPGFGTVGNTLPKAWAENPTKAMGIPQRTLTRRLGQTSLLTPAESDRTARMARVYANAVEMTGDQEKAIAWLGTPNRALAHNQK